jgi:hypothetical protein
MSNLNTRYFTFMIIIPRVLRWAVHVPHKRKCDVHTKSQLKMWNKGQPSDPNVDGRWRWKEYLINARKCVYCIEMGLMIVFSGYSDESSGSQAENFLRINFEVGPCAMDFVRSTQCNRFVSLYAMLMQFLKCRRMLISVPIVSVHIHSVHNTIACSYLMTLFRPPEYEPGVSTTRRRHSVNTTCRLASYWIRNIFLSSHGTMDRKWFDEKVIMDRANNFRNGTRSFRLFVTVCKPKSCKENKHITTFVWDCIQEGSMNWNKETGGVTMWHILWDKTQAIDSYRLSYIFGHWNRISYERNERKKKETWKEARLWGPSSIHWLKSSTFINVIGGADRGKAVLWP